MTTRRRRPRPYSGVRYTPSGPRPYAGIAFGGGFGFIAMIVWILIEASHHH